MGSEKVGTRRSRNGPGSEAQRWLNGDLLPWPIAIISSTGRLTRFNTAFAAWWQLPSGARPDFACTFAGHPALVEAVRAALAGTPPPQPIEVSAEGQACAFEVTLRAAPLAGDPGAVLFAAQPGEPCEQVERRERRAVLDRAMDRIAALIFGTADANAVLDNIVRVIVEEDVADSAIIYTRERGTWTVRHCCGLPRELLNREVSRREIRPSLRAIREERAVVINDAQSSDEVTAEWVQRYNIQALIDLAVEVPGTERANFAIHYHDPRGRKFDDQDVAFMERVAAAAALALRNARLIVDLQAERRQERKAQTERQESERQLGVVMSNIPAAIFMYDAERRLRRANAYFETLFGVARQHALGKTTPAFLPPPVGRIIHRHLRDVLASREPMEFEEIVPQPDGTERVLATIKAALRDDEDRPYGVVAIATDITERKRMEDRIRHVAEHDPLTGLPNRLLFAELLDLELAQARRQDTRVAVLYLDLDRFKSINDELGHAIGDALLVQVARRLSERVRRSDVVARIGGDEFNVILSNLASAERAAWVIKEMVAAFAQPFEIDGERLHVTPSIGVSIYPDDAARSDTLLRYADMAMYEAKRHGRNQVVYFNPAFDRESVSRLRIQHELRGAIERGELCLYFQPLVRVDTRRVFSAEALVRWAHPTRGLLEPAQFLHIAEDMGMLGDIEDWVLGEACCQARRWAAAGADDLPVTVNMGAHQFMRPDLPALIGEHLHASRLEPRRLQLEITEEAAMADIARALPQMQRLTEAGVRLALDDFGTGYSSLSYLKRMPVTMLKIDQSFVRDIVADPHDRAVVSAISALGHSMDIAVLAEGVETEDQLALIRSAHCDGAQGFLFNVPLDARRMLDCVVSEHWGS